jgi:endonuclease YncB( thermonuclease family)
LGILVLVGCAAAPVAAQDITGSACVIDGDTVEVAGQRIRLHGIDAPESKQRCRAGRSEIECGKEATKVLRSIIARESVTCEGRDVDRYGRIVAVCRNSDGEDINAAMVAQGWALAYRQFFFARCSRPWFANAWRQGSSRARALPWTPA